MLVYNNTEGVSLRLALFGKYFFINIYKILCKST